MHEKRAMYDKSTPYDLTKKEYPIGYSFLLKRETAHEVRGTSVLRGPEWNGDIEPSSPGLDSKKIRMILLYHPYFSERETGIELLSRHSILSKYLFHVHVILYFLHISDKNLLNCFKLSTHSIPYYTLCEYFCEYRE